MDGRFFCVDSPNRSLETVSAHRRKSLAHFVCDAFQTSELHALLVHEVAYRHEGKRASTSLTHPSNTQPRSPPQPYAPQSAENPTIRFCKAGRAQIPASYALTREVIPTRLCLTFWGLITFWGTSLLGATSTFGAKFKATDRQPFSLLKLQQNRHRQFLLLYDPDGSGVGCDLQADVDRVVFRIKEQETQHTPQGRSLAKTGTT